MKGLLLALTVILSSQTFAVSILENFEGNYKVASAEEVESSVGCSLKVGSQISLAMSEDMQQLNFMRKGSRLYPARQGFDNTLDDLYRIIDDKQASKTKVSKNGLMITQKTVDRGFFINATAQKQVIQLSEDTSSLSYRYEERGVLKELCFFDRAE